MRPSPTDTHLGGVAKKTREAMILCEAAGFDVIIVESVGVGQSEITLAGMVDCFVGLMLPNAGDELQGIKKGLLEWVDIIAINKSDGPNEHSAQLAQRDFQSAFRYLPRRYADWVPQVIRTSALHNVGIDTLWETIQAHHAFLVEADMLDKIRAEQRVAWFTQLLQAQVWDAFVSHPRVAAGWADALTQVVSGAVSIHAAVESMLQAGTRDDTVD